MNYDTPQGAREWLAAWREHDGGIVLSYRVEGAQRSMRAILGIMAAARYSEDQRDTVRAALAVFDAEPVRVPEPVVHRPPRPRPMRRRAR